jgi:hypothetical protein
MYIQVYGIPFPAIPNGLTGDGCIGIFIYCRLFYVIRCTWHILSKLADLISSLFLLEMTTLFMIPIFTSTLSIYIIEMVLDQIGASFGDQVRIYVNKVFAL